MKKLSLILILSMAALTSFAQNQVKPLFVTGVSNGNTRTDVGISIPAYELKYASANLWVLTDTKTFSRLHLGAGLSATFFGNKNFGLNGTAGWVADSTDVLKFDKGHWAVGAELVWKF